MRYVLSYSIGILIGIASLVPSGVGAQSQSLSVTPPLFQLSIEPGSVFQSLVRVVNPNEYPLTVYAEVANFVPEGEGGQGKFMPVLRDDESKATLAEWIAVAPGPYVIESGQTAEVSFIVDVPADAAPGGHFAAVLISTEPPKDRAGELALFTSQTVTSLFFLRVEGDVIESADIREFSVADRSIELPEAEFSLRFENKGNVHVQPRGSIVIRNMWGTERGTIPINMNSHFGNVLPASIRDFRFSWKGERSLTDIGRYTAEALLTFGEDGVGTAYATTHFWVIPIRGALITLGCLMLIVGGIVWMIRLYVRRMLLLAGVDPDSEVKQDAVEAMPHINEEKVTPRSARLTLPLREGTVDLRARLKDANQTLDVLVTIVRFVFEFKRFFVAVTILIAAFIAIVYYAGEVRDNDTDYEVTVMEDGASRTFTDEEIHADETKE